MAERKEWDVAISFASADEPLALQLRDLLQPAHSVFVYSKAQEQLAGRDGIEAFRDVFRDRATLVVMLYGTPWGETPWTRVEKTAIEELSLAEGWEHLMFVRLRAEPVPKWVPKPHLYLDMTTFTLADLVGAIKLRLAELGVESRPVTPADRAAAQERQRAFDAETLRRLAQVPNEFGDAVDALYAAIKVEADAIGAKSGWRVRTGRAAIIGGFMVTAQGQSIQLESERAYANSTNDCFLKLSEYSRELLIEQPGHVAFVFEAIRSVRSRRLTIRRLPELGWCWEIDGRVRSAQAAASAVMHVLLDRIDAEAARKR